jgi:hypothetical protein
MKLQIGPDLIWDTAVCLSARCKIVGSCLSYVQLSAVSTWCTIVSSCLPRVRLSEFVCLVYNCEQMPA